MHRVLLADALADGRLLLLAPEPVGRPLLCTVRRGCACRLHNACIRVNMQHRMRVNLLQFVLGGPVAVDAAILDLPGLLELRAAAHMVNATRPSSSHHPTAA